MVNDKSITFEVISEAWLGGAGRRRARRVSQSKLAPLLAGVPSSLLIEFTFWITLITLITELYLIERFLYSTTPKLYKAKSSHQSL